MSAKNDYPHLSKKTQAKIDREERRVAETHLERIRTRARQATRMIVQWPIHPLARRPQ